VKARSMLVGLLLVTLLDGCGVLQRPSASYSYDHAFIRYWPPRKESGSLRLAVKDLIDMKGVVTTAALPLRCRNEPTGDQ
jgi:amidase